MQISLPTEQLVQGFIFSAVSAVRVSVCLSVCVQFALGRTPTAARARPARVRPGRRCHEPLQTSEALIIFPSEREEKKIEKCGKFTIRPRLNKTFFDR